MTTNDQILKFRDYMNLCHVQPDLDQKDMKEGYISLDLAGELLIKKTWPHSPKKITKHTKMHSMLTVCCKVYTYGVFYALLLNLV